MHLEFVTVVHAPIDEVFGFFVRPSNLTTLMRGWPSFRLIRCAEAVTVGGQLWIEETACGIVPIAMGFEFTRYTKNAHFAETMIHGPFRRFDHVHTFEREGNGTVVRDEIECKLKWPYGAALATESLVAPRLRKLFAYRAISLQELARNGAINSQG
jgi:ligand-binding SRPBCC domain-containing protein